MIRAKAPLRVSFCGGGSDVPPYPEQYGGVVLSATVNKYAYATLTPREDRSIKLSSLDYGKTVEYDLDDEVAYDGELDIIKGVVQRMRVDCGLEISTHTDAPPGSGLGSSSAVVVAVIGAFARLLGLPLTAYEKADLAYVIERQDIGIKGGMQDQYAATFGGFNLIEFLAKSVIVNPLRVDGNVRNELEYRLLLCYTGKTRLSANIISDQIHSYVNREVDVLKAIENMKKITIDLKNALLQGKLDDFGRLLNEGWQEKQKVSGKISDSTIGTIYKQAKSFGALGGKLLGAGGGGYLLLCCEFDKRHAVAQALEKLGLKAVSFNFDNTGLQSWDTGIGNGCELSSISKHGVRSFADAALTY